MHCRIKYIILFFMFILIFPLFASRSEYKDKVKSFILLEKKFYSVQLKSLKKAEKNPE